MRIAVYKKNKKEKNSIESRKNKLDAILKI